jgi:hypothetical protein
MAKGDRNDPAWAWYWEEADKEEKEVSWALDPNTLFFLTQRVEDQYLPPAGENDPFKRAFREITRWLPDRYRDPICAQYQAGGRGRGNPRADLYRSRGIVQSSWVTRLDNAERYIRAIGPVYHRMEKECPGSGSLEAALQRVQWPETLRARVRAGTTAKAAALIPWSQTTIHERCATMAKSEPIVAVLMRLKRKKFQ